MNRIALFGCKNTTLFMLERLLAESIQIAQLITIDPALARDNEVADYCDLRAVAERHKVPLYHASRYSLKTEADHAAIAGFDLDLAFVIGWQRLLPASILNCLRVGAFGMHGSSQDLPIGRGRSPMNWSLFEGRGHFFTNLFRYNDQVDAGEIVDTLVFSIQPQDTAETMHFKNTLAMKRLIKRNLENLLAGRVQLQPQTEQQPTYYPKRDPKDSLIDWRWDITRIERFIRAVAPPFNGAFSYRNGEIVVLRRAAIFETDLVDFGYRREQPGRIVEIFPNGKFLVRCIGGLLLVHEHEIGHPLCQGDVLESHLDAIRQFPQNAAGFHDLPA